MTEKTLIVATAILCAFGWSCCNSTQDQAEKLNAEAAKEYLTPIRPASEGRNLAGMSSARSSPMPLLSI